MPTTSNFGWTTPADTDLVKDGASAIRTLGNGVDSSMAQLKGGTTGQVLSKTSGTDMAFTWVTTDDANAIQNAIVDAKGDLIAATANDTPARLAVGNNGETLVADSAASTGLRWQGNYSAGKNVIINADFNIWQRGTSFNNNGGTFLADRFVATGSGTPATMSQQTFTAGTAPVTGYEGKYYLRWDQSSTATATQTLMTRVENARTFGNQSVTFSFWAKINSGSASVNIKSFQNFGTGGSPSSSAITTLASSVTFTASWARYSYTFTNPSVSGKTFGTNANDYLAFYIEFPSSGTWQIDTWGWQAEASSVATAFQTATGTLAGELAACQRYYYRLTSDTTSAYTGSGANMSTTSGYVMIPFPVTMRSRPTALEQSGTAGNYGLLENGSVKTGTSVPAFESAFFSGGLISVGTTGLTAGSGNFLRFLAANAYLGWSAEL